jgi:ABC-type sugar transport system ATPase subunit
MLHTADQVCAVAVKALTKRFPGVVALDHVDFDVWTGEVHALVGANGAGKSTLIKMITGAEIADSGDIEIFGKSSAALDTSQRRAAGVSAIYQELTIIPEMTAAANVYLADPPRRGILLRKRELNRRFGELAGELGLSIAPGRAAGTLSIADRQMVEIMRALAADHRVLIMDEPTAALGPAERAKLFEVIEGLKKSGTAIVYISHELDEVLAISDRISVMRNGALVGTGPRSEWTKESMVRSMIGEFRGATASQVERVLGDETFAVDGLSVPGRVSGISFSVRRGEIFGIAGLVGSGRTEILSALAGADQAATGTIRFGGVTSRLPGSVRDAVSRGICLVPEDRKAQGFVPLLSGTENVILTNLGKASRFGIVAKGQANDLARRTTAPLGFLSSRLPQPMRTLSGGNQQKLVIGKWLHRAPKILLLDEPTRGVDVGAKAEIYAAIRRLTDDGLSVILVSSELPEVVEQSDRVLVISGGRGVATLDRGDATVDRILSLIFAVEGNA